MEDQVRHVAAGDRGDRFLVQCREGHYAEVDLIAAGSLVVRDRLTERVIFLGNKTLHLPDGRGCSRRGFGGKLNSYKLALGEYNGVAICEFPGNKAAVACSMSATATGGFSRVETTTLLTSQQAEAAMKQANQTKTEYKPPNA